MKKKQMKAALKYIKEDLHEDAKKDDFPCYKCYLEKSCDDAWDIYNYKNTFGLCLHFK